MATARDGGGTARRAAARESARAEGSAFRRRWTWRDRLVVAVGGALIAAILRLLYRTLRLEVADPAGVLAARARGERVVWATWHEGIILLPLMVWKVDPRLRPRVMLSWHRDGEIAAQAVRRFGVEVIRGSSTRGWLGALRGLLDADARGEDLVVVPDGPRGPRREAKDGVVQLARATGLPVVAIGIAASDGHRFGTWDRLLLPRPFARAALVLGSPVAVPRRDVGDALGRVQAALAAATAAAAEIVGKAV
ncbi:MAG: DUF374 domain-containing protein [bacterium]|nr:DUF374 domain-containing protein [bacterium]